MKFRYIAIPIGVLLILLFSCGQKQAVSDPPRSILFWAPPPDFKPSYITTDENGTYWGLFISKRYSAKDNLWAAKSRDGIRWAEPILVDNAYYFENLKFTVRVDSLIFTYYQIAPDYFTDHGFGVADFINNKDEMTLKYALKDLLFDRDHDSIPDKIEQELITSSRLPDTDLDGKPDYLDYNPLSKPRPFTENHKIYQAVLEHVLKTVGLAFPITIRRDSVWSDFYGITVLVEPRPFYIVLSKEERTFEFTNLPVPIIAAGNALWFGSKPLYESHTGGIIPHLDFKGIEYNLFRNKAKVLMESFLTREIFENYEFQLKKTHDIWTVKSSRLLPKPDSTQLKAKDSLVQ